MTEKTARCVDCRAEFTDAELSDDITACLNCGCQGIPEDPRKDVQVTINPHSLRILTIWAHNYAESHQGEAGVGMQKTIAAICKALGAQEALQGVPLSMGAELQELADTFGTKVEVIQDKGLGLEVTKTYEGKKPS